MVQYPPPTPWVLEGTGTVLLSTHPLAGFPEGAGTECALVRLVVGVDQPVPVEGALTAQHLPTVTTLEGSLHQWPYCYHSVK